MAHVRFFVLLILVGCHRPSTPSPVPDPYSRLRIRAAEMIARAKGLRDSGRYEQILWTLEIGTDDLLESTFNEYEHPPLQELHRVLIDLDPPYSPVRLTGWLPMPGSWDYIVGYSITPAPWAGSARLRGAHRQEGRYRLVHPEPEAQKRAEEELAYWRGGDLYARYGPPYKPGEIHFADCWGPNDLAPHGEGEIPFKFRASYGIGSTCPGEFEVIWSYVGDSLRPESYAWGAYPGNLWKRFYATPLLTLAKESEALNYYEGK